MFLKRVLVLLGLTFLKRLVIQARRIIAARIKVIGQLVTLQVIVTTAPAELI